MSEIRDEPAFPNEWCNELGMSMRDYFAAKAMQALITRESTGAFDFATHPKDPLRVAHWAYDVADQMLIVRAENE